MITLIGIAMIVVIAMMTIMAVMNGKKDKPRFTRRIPFNVSAGRNYQHHFEVHLRYLTLWPYVEHGTITLVIIMAPTVES